MPESKGFGLPVGAGLAPDDETLYAGDSRRRKLVAFSVAADSSLRHQRVFLVTGPGGVLVFDPAGVRLGMIRGPETPENCAWGDRDCRGYRLAPPTSAYRMRTKVRGTTTRGPQSKL